MRSRLNSSEGTGFCAVKFGREIVIDRARKIDGLPEDALLQELYPQDSSAALNSSSTPAHDRSIVASAMRDPLSGDDIAASADKECAA
jgi:hypothetical protein